MCLNYLSSFDIYIQQTWFPWILSHTLQFKSPLIPVPHFNRIPIYLSMVTQTLKRHPERTQPSLSINQYTGWQSKSRIHTCLRYALPYNTRTERDFLCGNAVGSHFSTGGIDPERSKQSTSCQVCFYWADNEVYMWHFEWWVNSRCVRLIKRAIRRKKQTFGELKKKDIMNEQEFTYN